MRIFFILVAIILAGGIWFVANDRLDGARSTRSVPTSFPGNTSESTKSPVITSVPKPTSKPQLILHDVPFVSQAPTGNWDDPRQQDGCEEAASFMAVLWARGEKPPTSLSEQEKALVAISDYEMEKYGGYHDTSVKDTIERIFKGYFNYQYVEAKYNITASDIKDELAKGNILVVLLDGQKIGNPYFTPPGPDRHALVIRGYDPETDEFITNDNGTRRGEGYRYKTNILMNAIVDYPTGDHLPIEEEVKAMIIVRKE